MWCRASKPALLYVLAGSELYFGGFCWQKIMFVTQVCTLLGLKHVFPKHERIEDEPRSNKFSVITSRAFTSLENFVELTTRPFGRRWKMVGLESKIRKE